MYSIDFKDGHRIVVKVVPDIEKRKSFMHRSDRIYIKKQISIKKAKSA